MAVPFGYGIGLYHDALDIKEDAAAMALEIISGIMSASLICKYSTDTNPKYGIICMSLASVPTSTSTMADDPCRVKGLVGPSSQKGARN